MISAGTLIWVSCRPLLKMLLCTTSGFVLTRYDLFNALSARGAAQVMLNVTFPCLMFSKMVPAFTPQNISALGPLITIGFIYQALGLLLSMCIREFFWVPHRFRNGLLVAGAFSNWGDVPTAVILSITAATPFGGPNDVNIGVAYISAFILVFFITLFPMGGHLLIAKDFEGPNKEDEEVKETLAVRQKSRILFLERCVRVFNISQSVKRNDDTENPITNGAEHKQDASIHYRTESPLPIDDARTAQIEELTYDITSSQHPGKRVSFNPLVHVNAFARDMTEKSQTCVPRAASYAGHDAMSPTTTMIASMGQDFDSKNVTEVNQNDEDEWSHSSRAPKSLLTRALNVIRTLLNPATISIAISFPIALIRPLKALFVPMDESPIPHAPDGYPPLYFILDTAGFLGAASVPLGLVCLGAALATMKVPKKWKSLPLAAISSLAIGKLIISPILGVLIVNAFVKIGFIHEDDKILRFVAMFFSCMPTATTQVVFTQIYSGTGEASELSAFLIPQYALMFVSTTVLTAYSLHLLF